MLSRLKDEPRVLSQLRGGMLLEELLQQRGQLEDLRACVSPLLGMRKQTCPRLFVLPDQDVVELLTKGQVSSLSVFFLNEDKLSVEV